MYASILKDKFPQDESNGLYKAPHLPAVKLGKILMKDQRIASPNDVVAIHLWTSLLGGGQVIFTADKCLFDGGEVALEDLKSAEADGDKLQLVANFQGQLISKQIRVKNEVVAKGLARILDQLAHHDPAAEAILDQVYEAGNFTEAEIDWLRLRDEILRTIDLLYDRYNDGKLSMLEYETKKEELLSRL